MAELYIKHWHPSSRLENDLYRAEELYRDENFYEQIINYSTSSSEKLLSSIKKIVHKFKKHPIFYTGMVASFGNIVYNTCFVTPDIANMFHRLSPEVSFLLLFGGLILDLLFEAKKYNPKSMQFA